MKIVFLTLDDYSFIYQFFKIFFNKRVKDVVHIVILTPRGYYKSTIGTLKNVFVLYGAIGFLRLTALIIIRKVVSYFACLLNIENTCFSVRGLAKLNGISFSITDSISDPKVINALKLIYPDVIFSVSLPQLIPAVISDIPKIGIFNIHTSLLPEYRGVLPVFWALFNDEKKIGSTIHKVSETIDAGDIILQDTFSVTEEDTLETCIGKGKVLGANLALRAMELIEKGTLNAIKMDLNQGNYYTFPKRKDIVDFKKKRRIF